MKTRNTLVLLLILATTSIGTAQADHGRHRGYYAQSPAYNHDYRYHHSRNWGVPAAVLAITGLAIGTAAYQSYQPRPSYIYNAPPLAAQPPPPESGNWYFCRSSGVYYPYTRSCPEGWQAVSPPR